MDIVKFVINLAFTAIAFLCAGTLVEIAQDLADTAARDTRIGIIELGKWNRTLITNPTHK